MSFKHINAEDRQTIAVLINEQRPSSYIARRIGVNRSTIGREISRNQVKPKPELRVWPTRPAILDIDCRHKRGSGLAQDKYEAAAIYTKQALEVRRHNRYYVGSEATKRAASRRAAANRQRIRLVRGSDSWLERYVHDRLVYDQWSPEQMSGDLRHNHNVIIYPQTIYDYIYLCPDKKRLLKYLRHGGNPYRHKRGTNARIKAREANLPSIHKRPTIVMKRTRLGDIEGDTIVGLDHTDRIATHVDRASGECRLGLSLGYDARKITNLAEQAVKRSPVPIHTITYDRGNEFSDFERLEKHTNAKVYFADAYSSWQRGSNENLNGLVRQYFPKRSDFKAITPRQLHVVEIKLNNRPRKRYNYRTPIQQRQYLLSHGQSKDVAIRDRI
jgi:IS30 family transposase